MKLNELDHPNGTYACLVPDAASKESLCQLQSQLNLPNPVSADDLHMTVIYSRTPCPGAAEVVDGFNPIHGIIQHLGYLPTQTGTTCLVAEVDCPDAHALHDYMRKHHGASHDYPSYISHITLSYDCPKGLRELFNPLKITFDRLKVSALNTAWQAKTS